MNTSPETRRIIRLVATAAAVLGLALIAAMYITGSTGSLAIVPLVGGALITHWIVAPRYSNGRAA